MAHFLQVLTEMDSQTTIVTIDGVGAYDSISRKAMLEALMEMPRGSQALPHVRLFYGQPSRYLWEDEFGQRPPYTSGRGWRTGGRPYAPPLLIGSTQRVGSRPGTVDQWRAVVRVSG